MAYAAILKLLGGVANMVERSDTHGSDTGDDDTSVKDGIEVTGFGRGCTAYLPYLAPC